VCEGGSEPGGDVRGEGGSEPGGEAHLPSAMLPRFVDCDRDMPPWDSAPYPPSCPPIMLLLPALPRAVMTALATEDMSDCDPRVLRFRLWPLPLPLPAPRAEC